MVAILKLGGSVITRKDEPETVDEAALERAAGLVGDVAGDSRRSDGPADLVIVHGGGSFGHHHAERHGVTDADGTRDVAAVADIHGAMCRLDDVVLEYLREAGVPAVPVHPLSAGARDASGDLALPSDQVATLLAEGFVPVLHGDGIAHAGAGVTVLSGDEIVVSLADSLDADRVGLCSTVPGVLDDDGAVVAVIDSYDAVADVLGGSDTRDVTGGMAGKVRALLDLSGPAWIFDLDGLGPFLEGDPTGTVVRGGR